MAERFPLVLIPGRMSTAVAWSYQYEAFRSSRPLIVPEGHFAKPSIREMALDILGRLPPRFDLMAWSMGGYVLFELFPLISVRIRRLVLVSTSARPESEESRLQRLAVVDQATQEGLEAVQAAGTKKAVYRPERIDPQFLARLHAASVGLGVATLRSQTAAIIARRDHRQSLQRITCPTLIIVGEHDTITPVECSREIARGIEGSKLHILHETGHSAPFEQPQHFNEIVGDFLDSSMAKVGRLGSPREVS